MILPLACGLQPDLSILCLLTMMLWTASSRVVTFRAMNW